MIYLIAFTLVAILSVLLVGPRLTIWAILAIVAVFLAIGALWVLGWIALFVIAAIMYAPSEIASLVGIVAFFTVFYGFMFAVSKINWVGNTKEKKK